jgi:hypothetical protein
MKSELVKMNTYQHSMSALSKSEQDITQSGFSILPNVTQIMNPVNTVVVWPTPWNVSVTQGHQIIAT